MFPINTQVHGPHLEQEDSYASALPRYNMNTRGLLSERHNPDHMKEHNSGQLGEKVEESKSPPSDYNHRAGIRVVKASDLHNGLHPRND